MHASKLCGQIIKRVKSFCQSDERDDQSVGHKLQRVKSIIKFIG